MQALDPHKIEVQLFLIGYIHKSLNANKYIHIGNALSNKSKFNNYFTLNLYMIQIISTDLMGMMNMENIALRADFDSTLVATPGLAFYTRDAITDLRYCQDGKLQQPPTPGP